MNIDIDSVWYSVPRIGRIAMVATFELLFWDVVLTIPASDSEGSFLGGIAILFAAIFVMMLTPSAFRLAWENAED